MTTETISDDIDRIATDIVRADYSGDDDPEWKLYDTIAQALMQERERCAKVLQPWKRRDHLSLHCGEVTAQEFRTVVAILISCQGAIRSPDKTP